MSTTESCVFHKIQLVVDIDLRVTLIGHQGGKMISVDRLRRSNTNSEISGIGLICLSLSLLAGCECGPGPSSNADGGTVDSGMATEGDSALPSDGSAPSDGALADGSVLPDGAILLPDGAILLPDSGPVPACNGFEPSVASTHVDT